MWPFRKRAKSLRKKSLFAFKDTQYYRFSPSWLRAAVANHWALIGKRTVLYGLKPDLLRDDLIIGYYDERRKVLLDELKELKANEINEPFLKRGMKSEYHRIYLIILREWYVEAKQLLEKYPK